MKVKTKKDTVEIVADPVGEGRWVKDQKILGQLAEFLRDEECVIVRDDNTQAIKAIKFFTS